MIEAALADIDKLSPNFRAPVTALIKLVGKPDVVLSNLWPEQFPDYNEVGTIEHVEYGRNWFGLRFRPNDADHLKQCFCRWS